MKYLIKFGLAAVIVALIICGIADASETISQDSGKNNAVSFLKGEVLSYFEPVTGNVGESEGGTVTISIGEGRKLKNGARLSVFRKGEPFYHPTTKELIGAAEDFAGIVEISKEDAASGRYICSVVSGDIKAGDIVRITSSKVKLAFFQDRAADWTVADAFFSSLKDTGRFDMVEKYSPNTEKDKLLEISKALGAEVMLFLSTPVVNNKRSLRAEMYRVDDSKLFSDMSSEVSSEYINELARYDDFLSKSLADKEPWNTSELNGGEIFAIGNITGAGTKELIASDGHVIRIYNMDKEMQEVWSITGSAKDRHISIDVLDLNNNGIDEIFVTSMSNEDRISSMTGNAAGGDRGSISSFVIEYSPAEGYKKIAEGLPYFLRVTSGRLLMQGFADKEIFSTPVYTGRWSNGRYEQDKVLQIPEGVNIYGFVYVDWQNKGDVNVMALNDSGFLRLYRNNEVLWESKDTYGKPVISFKKNTGSMITPSTEWIVRGRLIAVNTEKGQKVIVVRRNELVPRAPRLGSFSAEVYALSWDGSGMEEELMLEGVSGTVSDYWIEGKRLYLLARAGLFDFANNAVRGEISRPSILYYYNFEEK
ncbi:MAG: VCBS repeat-containing protein [Nitrospirae bacterium]|nr:VCBS repeat-containing protein [Nitrospirota bacterium]